MSRLRDWLLEGAWLAVDALDEWLADVQSRAARADDARLPVWRRDAAPEEERANKLGYIRGNRGGS